MGKRFRCTLRSDDAVKGAKERLPRKEEEEKEEERRRRKEGRGYSIEGFLPTANDYDTHCIILIDKIPTTNEPIKLIT